ncbi:MAG: GreA/GreB family elongation factor [Dehalococcoidia bacterium]
MSKETPEPQIVLTLGEAFSLYIETLKPEQRDAEVHYVRHFVQFMQADFRFESLTGSRVESYVEKAVKGTDPRAPDRVAALKRWFQFVRKKNFTTENFGLHVRVKKAAGRSGASANRIALQEQRTEMTAEGLAERRGQLEQLRSLTPDLISAVALAREDKDFRENAPLDAAREALAYNDGQIKRIEGELKHAVVSQHTGDATSVGSTVIVRRADTGNVSSFKLVSEGEANARESRISVKSPVGQKLLGCRVGDEVLVDAPSGSIHLIVESID